MIQNIIYGLVDPQNQEIRYIGRSSNGLRRPKDHMKPSSLLKHSHKNHWIKNLLSAGLTPEIVVIDTVSSRAVLNDAERFWIQTYRDFGAPLTNVTDGGQGPNGCKLSQAHKDKIGRAHKGMKRSSETRAKISEALAGKKLSDAHRQALSRGQKNKSAETKARMRLTHPSVVKTHCPKGHLYDEKNTYINSGKRHCRTCHVLHQQAYVDRRKSRSR